MMIVRINQWSAVWHIGEPFPRVVAIDKMLSVGFIPRSSFGASFSVQADGEELEHVLLHFGYIPHTRAPVQIWHGEFARFIIANLALKFTS